MPIVLITGGTGLIGKALTKMLLEQGYEIIVLTRNPSSFKASAGTKLSYAGWNFKEQTINVAAVQKADYIIHLAGAGVADRRWTNRRKKEIAESRIRGTELITKALRNIPNKVIAVVSASAIGWYTQTSTVREERKIRRTESEPPDPGFLGETCRLWEAAIDPVTDLNKRLVKLRNGIVLSNEGGALPQFKRPIRFGIAAILGNGKQMVSWIHIDDVCRMYLEAIRNDKMEGVYNAVAPNAVDNKTLTLSLAKAMKGRFFIPFYVPSFLLKLFLGEMSIEALKSAEASAEKIRRTGFQFLYPTFESALQVLIKRS
jgi:uncharacterized protein (TIGR01777 family)